MANSSEEFTLLFPSPVGRLLLCGRASAVTSLSWREEAQELGVAPADQPALPEPLRRARVWLDHYFKRAFHPIDFELAPPGTPFQQRVWRALMDVAPGETLTYAALAERAGAGPQAARAVGQAVGRNPIPILIPCHRVVGVGGLGGYSGAGGVATKRRLLALEGRERLT